MSHEWVPSTLGHGERMCKNCFITNREAFVLRRLNDCSLVQPKRIPYTILDTALDRDESNDPTDFLGEEHD